MPVVHLLSRFGFQWTACGKPTSQVTNVTVDTSVVTCERCKAEGKEKTQ